MPDVLAQHCNRRTIRRRPLLGTPIEERSLVTLRPPHREAVIDFLQTPGNRRRGGSSREFYLPEPFHLISRERGLDWHACRERARPLSNGTGGKPERARQRDLQTRRLARDEASGIIVGHPFEEQCNAAHLPAAPGSADTDDGSTARISGKPCHGAPVDGAAQSDVVSWRRERFGHRRLGRKRLPIKNCRCHRPVVQGALLEIERGVRGATMESGEHVLLE